MAATLQDVLDLAGESLNDSAGTRYGSAPLRHTIHGLLHAFRNRPDLFVGSLASNPISLSMTAGSTFPLPDEFLEVVADYVVARCEAADDEHVNSERSKQFYAMFGREVPA